MSATTVRDYYCKNCDDAFGPTSEKMDDCPNCGSQLETPVPREFYERYPECLEIRRLLMEVDDSHVNAGLEGDALLNNVVSEVIEKYKSAAVKFGPMRSPYEGWAVIKEKGDKLWKAVKKNDTDNMREEAIQVAAMGIRFLIDVISAIGKEGVAK